MRLRFAARREGDRFGQFKMRYTAEGQSRTPRFNESHSQAVTSRSTAHSLRLAPRRQKGNECNRDTDENALLHVSIVGDATNLNA